MQSEQFHMGPKYNFPTNICKWFYVGHTSSFIRCKQKAALKVTYL